jgi:hypothetical protein
MLHFKNFELINIFYFPPHCPCWPCVPAYSSLPYLSNQNKKIKQEMKFLEKKLKFFFFPFFMFPVKPYR